MIENNKECIELVNEIKKEMPNIILPSLGMYDEVNKLDINGKDFLKNNDIKEEET